MFRWRAGELRKDGFDFTVLLVPNRSTVYGPLLEKPQNMEGAALLLQGFEQQLRAAGVPALNMTAEYRAAAAAGLPRLSLPPGRHALGPRSHYPGRGAHSARTGSRGAGPGKIAG
ncbi:MAG: hypothetical protein LAN84_02635 [Acidobacteriia bacterium]|nr:hypothetical protein [Terriglobia bacterium]